MSKLPIRDIEGYIHDKTSWISPVHGYEHLRRTGLGAWFFAQAFGETREGQDIAYVAGLIHDLKRPSTEKIDHTDISVDEAKKILVMFKISGETTDKILAMIQSHRNFQEIPLNQQYVFLSDKLLEQSGAYIIFRRCYYVGECEDFKDTPFKEAMFHHWKERMTKFTPDKYHECVRKLATYQYKWQQDFFDAYLNEQEWAVPLAKNFFDYGRGGQMNLWELVKNYDADFPESKRIKDEAFAYMEQKKYSDFKKLLVL